MTNQAISAKTQETVHLCVLLQSEQRFETLYLRYIESPHAISPRSYLWLRMPAFCTCSGRVLLVFASAELQGMALNVAMEARTPRTLIEPAALQALFVQVRVWLCN
jgi:DNA-binding IclR family transcriptional regulator